MKKITEVDKYMTIKESINTSFKEINVLTSNELKRLGMPFIEINKSFNRRHKEYNISEAADYLSTNTAGMSITFKTNSKKLTLKGKVNNKASMWHMAPTGENGFDLYIKMDKYRLLNALRKDKDTLEFNSDFYEFKNKEERTFIINFPLYCGVSELFLLIDEDSTIKVNNEFDNKKWCIYGTSITQGGCVSRPGMCYTNILSRHYKKEVINLGFSGSGLGELSVAKMINEINDLEMVIIDFDANACDDGYIFTNLEPFIEELKSKNKDIKVVIISRVQFIEKFYNEKMKLNYEKCLDFEIELTNKLNKKYGNVYFIDGLNLLDDDYDEYTVDSIHLTDLGNYIFTKNLIPYLNKIIK
ncbi:MAG: SGNH/GDSL hydrolase family protein [bacterium]